MPKGNWKWGCKWKVIGKFGLYLCYKSGNQNWSQQLEYSVILPKHSHSPLLNSPFLFFLFAEEVVMVRRATPTHGCGFSAPVTHLLMCFLEFSLLFCFCFRAIPKQVWGTIQNARDQTWTCCVQDKFTISVLSLRPRKGIDYAPWVGLLQTQNIRQHLYTWPQWSCELWISWFSRAHTL